jgi:hypothetical protein
MTFQTLYRSRFLLAGVVVLGAALSTAGAYLWLHSKETPLHTQRAQELDQETAPKLTSAPTPRETDSMLLIVMLFMSATAAVAVASSFYLYRWRRILSADQRFVVPEALVGSLRGMGKEIRVSRSQLNRLAGELSDETQTLSKRVETTQKSVSELLDTTVMLQRALDQRDAEIQRLRQGYDQEIFRRFIARFVRVKQAVDDCVALKRFGPHDCEQLRRLLEDAFEECGVEQFIPPLGTDYRGAEGVADNPRVIHTSDPKQSFAIADILDPGYRFRSPTNREIISPARVSIFMARQEQG